MGILAVLLIAFLISIPISWRMLSRLAVLVFIAGSMILLVYETFAGTPPPRPPRLRDRNSR